MLSPSSPLPRTGYVVPWGDREILLRVLYENLQDRSKVLVNKKVVDVEHSSDGVKVSCQDGSTYEGDVLAGADGVFSKTREKLWQLAETEHPALVRADRNGEPISVVARDVVSVSTNLL